MTAGDRRPSGLVVRQSTTLLQRDIRNVQNLRVTSPARTLLDTARRLRPERLTRAINDLRLRDLLTIDDLIDVIARNPTHRAVTVLQPHLEFAQPEPTRSGLEDKFLPLLRSHGLPTPQINVHVAGFRVDAYFPDHRLIVELDGWRTHRTKERFIQDRRQDFAILAAADIPTVRLPSEDVSDAVVAQLRGASSIEDMKKRIGFLELRPLAGRARFADANRGRRAQPDDRAGRGGRGDRDRRRIRARAPLRAAARVAVPAAGGDRGADRAGSRSVPP